MNKVYIIKAKRTAIGSFLGSLKNLSPAQLGAAVIKNILKETQVDPSRIDEVVLGNVLPAGHKQGVGRQASILAGIPVEVPAYTVNIICGSGMKSVMMAYNSIKAGEADLIIAGGTESMSQAPYLIPQDVRTGRKMSNFVTIDHMVNDALTDAFNDYHMGITAENVSEKYNISREEQDLLAFKSQKKAIAAVECGRFKDEIVPIEIKNRKESFIFDTDEYPNKNSSIEKLGKLKPVFKNNGTVTAGNASGINDGASVMLVASESAINKYGLTPMAEIISVGQAGVDPSIMGMGPVSAIESALKKANLNLTDIGLIELNEAFAAQAIGVMKQLAENNNLDVEWFEDKTNTNGGAIALGHPVGASGNRITVTLLHEMKKREIDYGLASLCIGGGMGTAIIVKNIG